jgi:hypothetical protein
MSTVNPLAVQHLTSEIETLRHENEALLRELENAYAQLTAVLQVSQDETRIAYSELQEKLVVQEKKLVELAFLSNAAEALLDEGDPERLRRLVVEKICLILPVDLVLLRLFAVPNLCTVRERDLVREQPLDRARLESLERVWRVLEAEGRGAVLVADLDAAPDFEALRLRPDARSAACLELRARGRALGLLVLNSRLRANFRADQESLLASFAHQAAAALGDALVIDRHLDTLVRVAVAQGLDVAALERLSAAALPPGGRVAALRDRLGRWLAAPSSEPRAPGDREGP